MKRSGLAIAGDALLVAPRLLGASARVALARLLRRQERRMRRLADPAWLTAQLKLPEGALASARVQPVHSGTATRSRLVLEYHDQSSPPGPSSLFIKSCPPDFGSALFGALFDLGGNELSFYRHLRTELSLRAPRVHYCDGDSLDYIMLLEDLAQEGSDFRTLASKCSHEEARAVLTTLAQLHASFWDSERFDADLRWVKRLETNRDQRMLNLVRRLAVPIAFEKYGHVLPDSIREVLPHLMSRYLRLEQQWAEGPRTLIHGDAHLGNMYFQGGEAGLLDWQVTQLGQGMRDVGYFMVNSLGESLRLEHQEDLIRHYLAVLRDRGVSLDFDTAWRQYRLQSVYAWIAGVVTAPSNFQDEKVVSAGLQRSSKAILDLDAIALMREL